MASPVEGHRLGKAIADVYIASQEGVSQVASDAVCDLIEKLGHWEKRGFDERMRNSPYKVSAFAKG